MREVVRFSADAHAEVAAAGVVDAWVPAWVGDLECDGVGGFAGRVAAGGGGEGSEDGGGEDEGGGAVER